MKSRTKYLSAAAAVMLCGAAFAGLPTFIKFTPVGQGTYGDGVTAVGANEWYAICWSQDNQFDDITADCKATGSDDVVLKTLRVNSYGEIHTVIDQDDIPGTGGYFFVYLLDTRNTSGAVAETNPTDATEEAPAMVNGKKEVVCEATSLFTGACDASGKTYTLTALPEGAAENVAITAIDVTSDPANVLITVEGIHASLQYNVRTSDNPSGIAEGALDEPKASATGTIQFSIPKSETGGAQFFQVTRQPINNK